MNQIWPLVALALALLSALLVGRRLCREASPPLRMLAVLVLFVVFHLAQVHAVAAAELAGLLGAVTFPAMAAAGAVMLLLALGLTRAPAEALPASRDAPARARPDHIFLVVVICCFSVAVFLANSLINHEFGWDGLAYHLPLAVHWLQEQSLALPASRSWPFSLPANSEAGMMMFLGAGLQRLAFSFNFLAYLMAVLSVFLIARRGSETFQAAALSAILFAMLPIVQYQSVSAYVDLYGAGFILAGMAIFMYRNLPGQGSAKAKWYLYSVCFAGLAWGVAVGTKPVNYPYAALCCLGAMAVLWHERHERHDGKASPVVLAAVLIAAMLVPSAFWFLRALLATGNPFFPIEIKFLGATLFEGHPVNAITASAPYLLFVPSQIEWLTYPWVEFKNVGRSYGTGSGFGTAWATFVPLGLVYGLYHVARNLGRERTRVCALLLLAFFAFLALWWFGLRKFPRFGIPVLAMAGISAVPLFDFLIKRQPRALMAILILAFGATAVLSAFKPAHEIMGRIRANEWQRSTIYEIPEILDSLPEGAVVWNAGAPSTKNFPLAGAHLTNRVIERRWNGLEAAREFIGRNRIGYVVDQSPYCCQELELLGARRLFDGPVGPTFSWQVWQVAEPGQAEAVGPAVPLE